MFDIGFFELLIVAVVGLLVIGPERLPVAVRTCGLWIGRIKRSLTETRREIEQQLGADEIRRELRNEEIMRNLERMKETRMEIEQRIHDWENSATKTLTGEDTKSADNAKRGSESAISHQADPNDVNGASSADSDDTAHARASQSEMDDESKPLANKNS